MKLGVLYILLVNLLFLLLFIMIAIPISIIYILIAKKKKTTQFLPYMDKGKQGELLAFLEIEGLEQGQRILNNLFIPTELDKMTEIDLILINSSGIFIIESKNYCAWIFGNEKNKYWTQVLKKKKYQFYNPIWQNNGHIKAVMNILKLHDKSLYKSIIVFGNQCKLKDVKWYSPNVSIVMRFELRNKIKSYMTTKILSTEEVDSIYNTLLKYTYIRQDTISNHISQIDRLKNS